MTYIGADSELASVLSMWLGSDFHWKRNSRRGKESYKNCAAHECRQSLCHKGSPVPRIVSRERTWRPMSELGWMTCCLFNGNLNQAPLDSGREVSLGKMCKVLHSFTLQWQCLKCTLHCHSYKCLTVCMMSSPFLYRKWLCIFMKSLEKQKCSLLVMLDFSSLEKSQKTVQCVIFSPRVFSSKQ